jgi:ABC-type polar amino acid transport system ATPase subunit
MGRSWLDSETVNEVLAVIHLACEAMTMMCVNQRMDFVGPGADKAISKDPG